MDDTPPEAATLVDETFHAVHDADDGRLSVSVVTAVADALDVDPTTVAVPMFERVDPDALDRLFADTADDRSRTEGYVAFPLWTLTVVVHADGDIYVHPPDDDRW